LFYSVFSFSQDDREKFELCRELYDIVVSDQKYRGSNISINEEYPRLLDSLILSKGISKDTFSDISKAQEAEFRSQVLRLIIEKSKPKMLESDSLRLLQNLIDDENTARLIRIVKERGWLTAEKLECQEKFQPVLIFRHAPQKYWEEIRELIEKEKSAKRLSEYEYYLIDNHLKGRPPLKDYSDFSHK
jgi:hypothetical protein